MIKPMNYAQVVSDKHLREVGIRNGDYVLVTGLRPAPIKKDDPYLQRIFAHVIKVDVDGTHHMPAEDNDNMIYLVDPRNLQVVDENVQSEFEQVLAKQYS